MSEWRALCVVLCVGGWGGQLREMQCIVPHSNYSEMQSPITA